MLYKPKFCCECGVKIERGDWRLWTSRRFCQNCEIDKKAHEWTGKIAAAGLILFGLFGIGSFLQTAEKPLKVMSAPTAPGNSAKIRQVSPSNDVQTRTQTAGNSNRVSNVNQSLKKESEPKSAENPQLQLSAASEKKSDANEPVYFCGAQTKKGTPCSRRVKGGGRCWQHAGQAALLAPEKLRISQ
jgi:hypothetical protein